MTAVRSSPVIPSIYNRHCLKSSNSEGKKSMNTTFISIAIGTAAGLLDILPMILQKQEKSAIISAFLQYFFVSIIIVNINLFGLPWWLQGGLIALAMALPVVVIVAEKDKKAVPIICGTAVVLGTLISLAGQVLL